MLSDVMERNDSVSDRIPVPVLVADASVERIRKKKEIIHKLRYLGSTITNSFGWCLLRFFGRKILLWLGCILFVFLALECAFGFWVWQMPKEQLDQFTSCLDAGVVPSFKERFIYHLACFWGTIGG